MTGLDPNAPNVDAQFSRVGAYPGFERTADVAQVELHEVCPGR